MKDYCWCCGKLKQTKKHNGMPICASCVRKIHAGKEKSFEEIKKLQDRFDFVFKK